VHQPLVGVHPLVRDGADLLGVLENARDEGLGDIGELQRVIGAVEGVRLTFEQAHVGVHGRAWVFGKRLGHERGSHPVTDGDLLDHVAKRHHVVGHRQRVGVAQVDLLLARRALVVAELDRDAICSSASMACLRVRRRRARPDRSSRRCRRAPAPSRPPRPASAGRTRSRDAHSGRSRESLASWRRSTP
jgi:hypothetical protein